MAVIVSSFFLQHVFSAVVLGRLWRACEPEQHCVQTGQQDAATRPSQRFRYLTFTEMSCWALMTSIISWSRSDKDPPTHHPLSSDVSRMWLSHSLPCRLWMSSSWFNYFFNESQKVFLHFFPVSPVARVEVFSLSTFCPSFLCHCVHVPLSCTLIFFCVSPTLHSFL